MGRRKPLHLYGACRRRHHEELDQRRAHHDRLLQRGTRPVVFKIERIDVPENAEDEAYLATHDFSCSKEDAYTG